MRVLKDSLLHMAKTHPQVKGGTSERLPALGVPQESLRNPQDRMPALPRSRLALSEEDQKTEKGSFGKRKRWGWGGRHTAELSVNKNKQESEGVLVVWGVFLGGGRLSVRCGEMWNNLEARDKMQRAYRDGQIQET